MEKNRAVSQTCVLLTARPQLRWHLLRQRGTYQKNNTKTSLLSRNLDRIDKRPCIEQRIQDVAVLFKFLSLQEYHNFPTFTLSKNCVSSCYDEFRRKDFISLEIPLLLVSFGYQCDRTCHLCLSSYQSDGFLIWDASFCSFLLPNAAIYFPSSQIKVTKSTNAAWDWRGSHCRLTTLDNNGVTVWFLWVMYHEYILTFAGRDVQVQCKSNV